MHSNLPDDVERSRDRIAVNDFDVIVLGGGAAGLMCAIAAGQRGRRVVVLEGSNKIGKKILMSGGGRCNFTNLNCDPSRFVSENPKFCISALSRYTQWDFISLVDKHGVAYHEKVEGQLFCDNSSKDILNILIAECDEANVKILTHCDGISVTYDECYRVTSNHGAYLGESLVVATGGLSIPKMGASDFGYRLARQFGLNVLETRAGLVPFTFTGSLQSLFERLSGVSAHVTLSNTKASFTEDVLFTHRGLSGPAALQLSSYWEAGSEICLNLLPDNEFLSLLLNAKSTNPSARIRTVIGMLPRALVRELESLWWLEFAEIPLAEISDEVLRRIAVMLQNWRIRPAATEGYRTAEVTMGGIDTNELSSQTLESKRQPGFFCIGEVVDVTGQLGGFNFQWAWASGQAAGRVV